VEACIALAALLAAPVSYVTFTLISEKVGIAGRGLHSSTFRLNLSAFCGIGVHQGVV